MRRRRVLGVVTAVLLGAVPALLPSPAWAVGAGEVAFECHARMGSYPGTGTGTCGNGLIPAMAQVSASGLDAQNAPFIAAGVQPTSSAFNYFAECIAGAPPVTWSAAGTSVVPNIPAFAGGMQTTAELTVYWTATVVGTDIFITVTGGELEFANGRSAHVVLGSGTGQWFPLASASNICPMGSIAEALVQGEVDLVF